MKSTICFLFLFLALSTPAEANNFAARTLGPGSPINGRGWRSHSVAPDVHDRTLSTGWGRTFNGSPVFTRGYLIFDLKNVGRIIPKNYAVDTAELQFKPLAYESPDTMETLGIFDVTTPAAAVGAKFVVDPAIFDDLGTGALYASADIAATNSGGISVNLNATAIRDITRCLGDLFAVGLSLITARPDYIANERLFSAVGGATLRLRIAGPGAHRDRPGGVERLMDAAHSTTGRAPQAMTAIPNEPSINESYLKGGKGVRKSASFSEFADGSCACAA
jgi:hypothetical protein